MGILHACVACPYYSVNHHMGLCISHHLAGASQEQFPCHAWPEFYFWNKIATRKSSFYCLHDWLRGEKKLDKSEKYEKWIKLSECWMSHHHFSPIKCNTSNFLVGVEQTERKNNEGWGGFPVWVQISVYGGEGVLYPHDICLSAFCI